MATLTALSLLIGSAALAGTATLAGNMENAPPPEPDQVVQTKAPPLPVEEPVNAAPVPVVEPVNTATAPSLPIEEPVNDMAGGAIGRPPWGQLSSNISAPEVPGATVSSVLGIKENPVQLKNDLMTLERQIENANFEVYQLTDKIAEVNKFYTVERAKFIAELSKSKQAETTASIYQKKLGNQGQQKSNKDPAVKELQAQIDRAPAGSDERKRLQAEKDAMTQAKPASDKEIEEWSKKFSEATAEKVAADDDKAEAERKKNKYGAQLTELRTKQDEQEKLVKELIQKRAVLLGRLKTVLNENIRKEPPPADWQVRTARFAKADKARVEAERRLKQFYSDTWLPLQGQESQKQYQEQLNSLTVLWKNAKAEYELARAALTAAPQDSITTAGTDFRSFVVEVNDITRNAMNPNRTIKDEWIWRPGTMRGYPESVMILKSYAVKPKIVAAADVYYEIAKMDSTTLVRNAPRFIDYFDRLIGSITRAAESEKRQMPSIGREITKVVLKEFVTSVLANAANDVVLYPGVVPDEDPQARAYADLREKTNAFVDAQIYFINKMFKNIKQARRDTKLSNVNGKNMIDLETKARLLYPILDGVPAMGQCARIFKPSTLEMLRSGKRNGKDILTEVLETPTLKDDFLKEIGFVKVSSFLEAQQFGKQRGVNPADAIELIKKAAFEEYTKNAERLAFEEPDGQSFARIGGDWRELNAMNDLRRLTTYGLDSIFPVPTRGRYISNKTRALELRAEANLHPFIPGVFLESNRVVPGPVSGRRSSLEPISEFRNACEIDGNVGSGKEEADRIIVILDKLRDMEIEIKEKPSALLNLIDKLTKDNKINMTRPDQAEPISALNQKGFGAPVDSWLIMKVATQDKKLNFIQTFLTFRSSLFRTIPYDDTVVSNGKTTNTREVYSNLVFDEIQKMPSFDVRTEADKTSFPSDADWVRLSNDFNLNFVIYSDENGIGRTDMRAANRPNTSAYHIFKEKNGRYFPIRMNPGPVVAPGLPAGRPGSQFTTFNRGILGGAIDGVRITVPKDEVTRSTGNVLAEAIEASKKSSEKKDEAAPPAASVEPPPLSKASKKAQKKTGDTLAEAIDRSKDEKAKEIVDRCREVLETVMKTLPDREKGKSFRQLDDRYKNIVRRALEASGFEQIEIEACLITPVPGRTDPTLPTPPPDKKAPTLPTPLPTPDKKAPTLPTPTPVKKAPTLATPTPTPDKKAPTLATPPPPTSSSAAAPPPPGLLEAYTAQIARAEANAAHEKLAAARKALVAAPKKDKAAAEEEVKRAEGRALGLEAKAQKRENSARREAAEAAAAEEAARAAAAAAAALAYKPKSNLSKRAREALGDDDDDEQPLNDGKILAPPPQPIPTIKPNRAYSRRARAALLDDSDLEGGSKWRRSKPSRYTRRKF